MGLTVAKLESWLAWRVLQQQLKAHTQTHKQEEAEGKPWEWWESLETSKASPSDTPTTRLHLLTPK